jgi:diguanylate cyclase (GGDEF)-like protein/PAS domain S-box-containing protein
MTLASVDRGGASLRRREFIDGGTIDGAFDSLPSAVLMASSVRNRRHEIADFRIEYANATARRALQGSRALVGDRFSRRWPDLFPSVIAACRDVVEQAKPLLAAGVRDTAVAAGTYDLELSPWGDGLLLHAQRVAESQRGLHEHESFDVTELVGRMTHFAVVRLDARGSIQGWNAGAERLMGYESAEIVGSPVARLYSPQERTRRRPEKDLAAAGSRGQVEIEGWCARKDGSRFWADVILLALKGPDQALEGFIFLARDISKRRRAADVLQRGTEALQELASTDPLTGLKNRREFDRMLRTIPREPFAALAIDVDHLKTVNDSYGHEAGDALLRVVATTLSLLLRGWDVLGRLGGDEFGALLPKVGGDEAAKIAERMRLAVRGIAVPTGQASISVGWAAAPAGADPRTVWKTADQALFRAKRAGRDQVSGGDYAGSDPTTREGPSESEVLADVLGGGHLSTVFQPIVEIRTGAIVGYEALARPAHFAPTDSVEQLFQTARRLGHIADLDWICRRTAVRDAKALPEGSTLFLNISMDALLHPHHAVDQLLLLLESGGLAAERTVLEITEQDDMIPDPRRLKTVLSEYREHGIRFAFDDVGEGQLTLELLVAAEPEYIKVARSLTMTSARPSSRAAFEATLAFARAIGTALIAEGVENQYCSDQMLTLGVSLGQGFGLGKPAAAATLIAPPAEWTAHRALRSLRRRSARPVDRP